MKKTYPLNTIRQAWGAGFHAASKAQDEYAYFHSWNDDGSLCWQGKIIKTLPNTDVIVQLFNWAGGEPSDVLQIPISQMQRWNFYRTEKEWIGAAEAYNHWRSNQNEN